MMAMNDVLERVYGKEKVLVACSQVVSVTFLRENPFLNCKFY